MKNKRIIIVQPSLPAYRCSFFVRLAETLKQEITILHFGQKSTINHPLIHQEIGHYREFKSIKFVLNIKIVKDYHTIVSVFDPHWINLFFLPLTNSKQKVILWGHGLGKNKSINKLRAKLFKLSSSIITYSEERKHLISKIGVDKTKIFVANNTIEVPNKQNTSATSERVFLYVGRLQRRKKLDIFFEIFKELELDKQNYKINIVGEGEEEKLLLQKISRELNIQNSVQFFQGTSDDQQLLFHFSKAMYYISPGAVGLGVLHSFAYGVPVLTMSDSHHGPEVDNIKQNVNGMIFKDQNEFKNALLNLLSTEKYIEMGTNSYFHYINERSMENMVSGFVQALEFKN